MFKANSRIPLRTMFTKLALICLLVLPSPLRAQAPDLTTTDLSTISRAWTYNLGATGMRGWIYHAWPATPNIDDVTLFAPYQILVTTVAAGTPAAGVMAVDDVILGASAATGAVPLFTTDARKSLGWAIGDAEAGNGVLKLKRWRAGVTSDVSISLPVMGAYSDTTPYNCPKAALVMANAARSLAQRINAEGWGEDDGRGAVKALALMASGIPEYQPMVQALARHLAATIPSSGQSAWAYYNTVFLAEYYMLTNDSQVFPALSTQVIYAAKRSSMWGTCGHGFADVPPPGGWASGHQGSMIWYGPVNSAGLVANLAIVLGKKAGVVDPAIDPAIARAAGFFGHFVNAGSIPYGENEPWYGEHQINGFGREYYDQRSNGKDALAAVMFSCMGDKPAQAEYFARMSLAAYRGEAYGHTGQGFSYLWTALGANMGGQSAATEYQKQLRWDRDLRRRCDGSFVYEGGEQWAPGQSYDRVVNGQTVSAYWDNTYEYWSTPTASYLLHAAMPLKRLYITGKGLDPANSLSAQKVSNAVLAGTFASLCGSYTKAQLIAALGEYMPMVRLNAAAELATRALTSTELNTLIAMAENPNDAYQRNGACTALGNLKATRAIPALTRRLKDSDMWVRANAAKALGQVDAAAVAEYVPGMIDAFVSNVTPTYPWEVGFNSSDPMQMANGFLAGTLFNRLGAYTINADKSLLYPAVRAGITLPNGSSRYQLNNFVESKLTLADVQALIQELLEDAKTKAPSGANDSGVPQAAAMNVLAKYHIPEGIQVSLDNVLYENQAPAGQAIAALARYGEAARWTLPALYSDLNHWRHDQNYGTLAATVTSLEAATSSSLVYALPVATPQILATAASTAKAITLTGSSCRTAVPTCAVVTPPAHGTLTGTPPNLTYTPTSGYQGMDSFTFTAADSLTTSSPATVHLVVGTGGSGLTGSYYDNTDFTGFKATRIDSSVNFDWGTTPPNTLSAGTYSVRWTGQVLAPETGTYRFSTRTSDGVRLWVNGVQMINDWNNQATNLWNDSATITLTAGHKYHLKMEYYDNANPATVRLYWYMPSRQAQSIIPQEVLFPVAGVTLTSPQDGARIGVQAGLTASVTLMADTSDMTGTVASVAFYNGSTLIGSAATAPYAFTWSNVAVGAYEVTAKALDGASQVLSTSPVASITVDAYSVPVTAGLACHFDAGVGIVTDANRVVQSWQDRSGNGHHATLDTSVWNSGAPTLAANQLMGLPAVQMRGAFTWFNVAGGFHTKEQYLVVRSPNATWSAYGSFLGRVGTRASSYMMNPGGTGFSDNSPLTCSRNGVSTFNLAPITDYMLLRITMDDRADAANLAAYPYYQIGRNAGNSSMDFDVAEIIGYSNALSPSDAALVGGYLAAKYGITTTYPATGSLANKAATAITTTSATLNATLKCNSNAYNVVAYWGPVNGGTNLANWANSAAVGSGITAASIDLSQALTNLDPATTYYYTFRASNAQQTLWPSAPLSFTTSATAKDFLSFGSNVAGSSAVINTVAGTVAWTVPFGTSLTSLAPAYTVSALAAGSPASGTTLSFATPQTYTITAQDGSTKVYTVTASVDSNAPAAINATLTALEDTATALAAANFGHTDPNSVALEAVQITSLPAKGTLKLSGTTVVSGSLPLTVAVASIDTLTYQSALNENGTPYTTIGIKVKNATGLWSSAPGVMTVNVTPVNDAPTSDGGSVTLKNTAVQTFSILDYPFDDLDSGNTLAAIKITSLPTRGTLKLGGADVSVNNVIATAAIPTLTYTPTTGDIGADSFRYQVSDGVALSANATMAITVESPMVIDVANGSFETPGSATLGGWTLFGAPWSSSASPSMYQQRQATAGGTFTNAADGLWSALISTNDTPATAPLVQNLWTSVAAGDTLAVSFSLGRAMNSPGGKGVAYFQVDSIRYNMTFDTTVLAANTWQSYTMSKTVINSGNVSLGFYGTTADGSWLDKISNVSVTSGAVGPNAPILTNPTLTALEDVPTALATSDLGYTDPNDAALASVQILSLPDVGTLMLNGTTVANGALPLTVAAANIGTLSYQSAAQGYGTPYTTFVIKAGNANSLWSLPVMMTVNVTHVNHAPTSAASAASLKANAVKTFAATDFPFADRDVGDTLGAVMVTLLPAHGTLSLNGTNITSEPSAAIPVTSIANLTYTPSVDYGGADSFNFQVRDASLFSAGATMAITVIPNSPPTSTGGAVSMPKNTVHTLAATDFPFADRDVGDTLGAVMVTLLPAHGTLSLNGTDITSVPSAAIPVASIGTLTYTPAAGYTGADMFKFQVRDATAYSADAIMVISITSQIVVQNGSFETPGTALGGPWFEVGSPWSITGSPSNYQVIQAVAGGYFSSTDTGGGTNIMLISVDDCPLANPLVQNLSSTVSAGDTLSVTFSIGKAIGSLGGTGVVYFDVAGQKYTMVIDTTGMTANSWQTQTFTQTITNSGNLTLGFYSTSVAGRNSFVDKVSNISVTPAGDGSPPTITTSPSSTTINSGSNATLSVTASGTGPLSYQWYQGASGNSTSSITNATSASYTTPALTATTSYWVKVTNAANPTGVNSATATVTVNDTFASWQASKFNSTQLANTAISGATADPDGDGITNGNEYIFGTLPLTSNTPPVLTTSSTNGQTILDFTATAASGTGYVGKTRNYSLQSSTTLTTGSWSDLTGFSNIIGSNQAVHYTTPTSGSLKFYRLRVWLTP